MPMPICNILFINMAVLNDLLQKREKRSLKSGQQVTLSARLETKGVTLTVDKALALLRLPDGTLETVQLTANDRGYRAELRPQKSGLYSVEVILRGKTADGFGVGRAA